MTTVNLYRIVPETSITISTGQTILEDSSESSSSITGSIIIAGGVGIGKKLFIGTDLSVTGNITSGTWNGEILSATYGGTGASTLTSNSVLLGNGASTIQSPGTITYSSNTLTLPKVISNDDTNTTSNSTGSVILSGGQGIAKNLYIGGGTIGLDNDTSNLILYNTNGIGSPSFTSRSIGTKIVVSPNLSGSSTDYGMGMELNNMWFDCSSTTSGFKWYHGTLNTVELSSTQMHIKPNTLSSSTVTGAIRVNGGVGIAGALYADSMSITNAIISGTWNGSIINPSYGGTGASTLTANSVLLGNGTGTIQSPGTITYTSNTLTLPKIISNDSTDSVSNSTGSVTLLGGQGISKNLSVGGGTIRLDNATSNFLVYGQQEAIPSQTTRSIGTKSVLGSYVTASTIDFAIGIEPQNMWFSVPSGSTDGFKWYQGNPISNVMSLNNTGLNVKQETESVSSVSGSFITAGGAGIAKKLFVGTDLSIGGNVTSGVWNGSVITVTHGGTGASTLTSNSVLLGNGTGVVQSPSSITYSTSTLTLPKIISNDSTPSTSNLSGAVLLSGGLGLSNATDSTSSTNGGSVTTAGGAAIAKKLYVGGVGHFLSTINMNNTKILNLASPTVSSDGVNKSYVDGLVQGLSTKNSVRIATVSAGTLVSSFENGDTIDDIVLVTGDRILIKDQVSGVENGIYTVNSTGTPTRSDDLATSSNSAGVYTFVETGTVNGDNGLVCINDTGTGVVGTDALVFTQFSGAGQIDAGTGLTKSGSTLNVDSSQTHVTQIGTLVAGIWNANVISATYGGTGASTLTSNSVLLGNGSGTIQSPSTITYNTSTLTLPKIISNDSTSSTSNSIGAVLLSGGIGISNDTDATSITNGGSITTAGGVSIEKKLYVGGNLNVENNVKIYRNGSSASLLVSHQTSMTNYTELCSANIAAEFSSSSDIGDGILRVTNGKKLILQASGSGESHLTIDGGNNGNVTIQSNTASTNSTTGGLKVKGGIGIENSTDATSSTNGGSFTTAGGLAIAKKLFVGSVLEVDTSSSIVKINSVNVTPSSGDISETSFSAVNNIAAASITGFVFANGSVRSFKAICSVVINSDVNLFALFELTGIQKGASWEMTSVYTGDETNITFTITSSGQIQYTSGNETGFISNDMKFRAYTTSV
jgi:hypothetical protein